MSSFIYITAFIVFFCLLAFLALRYSLLVYASFWGAPFVVTKKVQILDILKPARLRENETFLELGCGDGRVVSTAVKQYGVKGVGVDVNPLHILSAKIQARFNAVPMNKITFAVEDARKVDLSKTDVVFLFLLKPIVKELQPKFIASIENGTKIISHAFPIPGAEQYLQHTREVREFPSYYYWKDE